MKKQNPNTKRLLNNNDAPLSRDGMKVKDAPSGQRKIGQPRDNYEVWFDDCKKYFSSGNIGGIKKCFEGFMVDGRLLMDLSVMEQRMIGLVESEKCFRTTEDWFSEIVFWRDDYDKWKTGLGNKDDRRTDIVYMEEELSNGYRFWGWVIAYLARIEKEKNNDGYAMELFKIAVEKYETAVKIGWKNRRSVFYDIGVAYFRMSMISDAEKNVGMAQSYFMKSGRDIMGILVDLDDDAAERLSDGELLYELLGGWESEESRFFRETTKDIDEENKDVYKNIYIRSIYIISRLKLDGMFETNVANYQKIEFAQKMLLDGQRFHLRDMDHSTDKKEGGVLLKYLFGNWDIKKEGQKSYGAFAGCFTFSYDSNTHYERFANTKGVNGAGLSIVFNRDFFGGSDGMAGSMEKPKGSEKEEKCWLYRCIYFDPNNPRVVAVGRVKQEFFGDGDNAFKRYDEALDELIKMLDRKIKSLRDCVLANNDLVKDVVGLLLIRLRYLIKDVAFEDEQECRIVKICRLSEKKHEILRDDGYSLYVEYEPIVSAHVNRIYFGKSVDKKEEFQDFLRYKGLDIPSVWSRFE
jgi:hypothetical protein